MPAPYTPTYNKGVDTMTTNNKFGKARSGNVIALNDKEPLLKSMGYLNLLKLISLDEVEEARELLGEFLKHMPNVEDRVVYAYLIGVMQGSEETYNDLSNSLSGWVEKLEKAYETGMKLGVAQTMIQLKYDVSGRDS